MLQNSGNPSNGAEDMGRSREMKEEQKRYDGFEGMNYEQRRQPYHTRQTNNRNEEESNQGGNGRPQGD